MVDKYISNKLRSKYTLYSQYETLNFEQHMVLPVPYRLFLSKILLSKEKMLVSSTMSWPGKEFSSVPNVKFLVGSKLRAPLEDKINGIHSVKVAN